MNSPQAALCFDGVSKAFGGHRVLADVSLSVERGERFGLIGVNGAGKTTLLKLALDFLHADGGRIRIAGRTHRDAQARRAVAYLPERFSPPAFACGAEFLQLLCDLHDQPYVASRAHDLCRRLDLDDAALSLPVRTYSKGMTQKLGLIACLLADTDLLMFDEPMSGLDPKARALLKTELLSREGDTLFFSTHQLNDVEELCHRLAVLHAGSVAFVGTVAAFCETHRAETLEQAFLSCISA